MGKLALSIQQPLLAQKAFEMCQNLNANHWPSMNGLLDALVLSNSWGAAYGWATHCLRRNPNHSKAIQVLLEVSQTFPEATSYLKK